MPKLTFRPRIGSFCKLCSLPCVIDGIERDAFKFNGYCLHLECTYKARNIAVEEHSLLRKERNPTEYYETPELALEALGEVLSSQRIVKRVPPGSLVWEPTDANRRIGDYLREQGFKVISSDICPRTVGVTKANFLESKTQDKCSAIIFNPPFGEFQRLRKTENDDKTANWPDKCKGWLPHALNRADIVIALLPASLVKTSFYKKFEVKLLYYKEIHTQLSFSSPFEPKPLRISCNWYVWDRHYTRPNGERYEILNAQEPVIGSSKLLNEILI